MEALLRKIDSIDQSSTMYGFISSAWLKSYRASQFAYRIPAEAYYREHEKIVEALITNNDVIMLTNPEDTDQYYGFAVFKTIGNACTLHYIYVKKVFRRLGFASRLLESMDIGPDTTVIHSHYSRDFDAIAQQRLGRLVYFPYSAIYLGGSRE